MPSAELFESIAMIAVITAFIVGHAVYLARKEDRDSRQERETTRAA